MAPRVGVLTLLSLYLTCWTLGMDAPCTPRSCDPTDCACPSRAVPGGGKLATVPEMVLVRFQGRLGSGAEKLIHRLFSPKLKNPNKCPIVSTFFVTNANADYCSVNRLWAEGHEIGLSGLTSRNANFWMTATADVWVEEISRQIELLHEHAGISTFTLEGWRSPSFQPGGDIQFTTLNLDFLFTYDSTLQVPAIQPNNSDNSSSYWPFTLNLPYTNSFPCVQRPCPEKSHEGLWELPTTPLWDTQANKPCVNLHACPSLMRSPDGVYNLLHTNFQRHFTSNRSPFLIDVSPRWLMENEEATKGLENFLLDMVKDENVWIVSGSQAIRWSQNPVVLEDLNSFLPWGCVPRRYKTECKRRATNRRKDPPYVGGLILNANNSAVIIQYIAFALLFFALWYYERHIKQGLNYMYY